MILFILDNISFPPKFKILNHYNDKDLLFLDMFATLKFFFIYYHQLDGVFIVIKY